MPTLYDYAQFRYPGQSYQPAYGGIPNVPMPTASAGAATTGNLANLGNLRALGPGASAISALGARKQYELNLPSYRDMLAQSSRNIGAGLRGEVTPEEWWNIQSLGAQRFGAGAGLGALGGNVDLAMLRLLGQTGRQRMDMAETQLTQAIGRTPTGPAFDVNRFLPGAEEEQAAQMAAANLAVAPDPYAAAMANLRNTNAGLNRFGFGGVGAMGGYSGFANPNSPEVTYDTLVYPSLASGVNTTPLPWYSGYSAFSGSAPPQPLYDLPQATENPASYYA